MSHEYGWGGGAEQEVARLRAQVNALLEERPSRACCEAHAEAFDRELAEDRARTVAALREIDRLRGDKAELEAKLCAAVSDVMEARIERDRLKKRLEELSATYRAVR